MAVETQMDPSAIQTITFDCYGTLVDWETGIRNYVEPILAKTVLKKIPFETWFARWEEIQFELLVPYRPYREVLERSFEQTMRAFELETFADNAPGLWRSVGAWPLFGDTKAALRRLGRRYRLALVSNIDNDLLADTMGRLQAPFSALVTAEDAKEYKPGAAPFRLALERLGDSPGHILHAAFGWKYDLSISKALGFRTAFINRGGLQPRSIVPDVTVNTVSELADLLGV